MQNATVLRDKALHLAIRVHSNEFRKGNSNVPYVFHCFDVADEVIRYSGLTDSDLFTAVILSFLHDILENTKDPEKKTVLLSEVRETFGNVIADGLVSLSKDESIMNAGAHSKKEQLIENLARLIASPVCVQVVKLADRISNLKYFPASWSHEKIANYLEESRLIAQELGSASEELYVRLLLHIEQAWTRLSVVH